MPIFPRGSSRWPLGELKTDRVRPIPYGNPEGLIGTMITRFPFDGHGDRVAASTTTAVIANSDLASGRRQSSLDVIAKFDDGLAISGLTYGENGVARTGVGKVGDLSHT